MSRCFHRAYTSTTRLLTRGPEPHPLNIGESFAPCLELPVAKMPSTESESPDDSFFNDLARSAESNDANGQDNPQDAAAKVKRIACVLCRKRKLKCDGMRPTCGTCKRLSHECAYDEVRKKSGPKRGYVKLLEQRLRKSAHSQHVTICALTLLHRAG